jgi:hypothetical protein
MKNNTTATGAAALMKQDRTRSRSVRVSDAMLVAPRCRVNQRPVIVSRRSGGRNVAPTTDNGIKHMIGHQRADQPHAVSASWGRDSRERGAVPRALRDHPPRRQRTRGLQPVRVPK